MKKLLIAFSLIGLLAACGEPLTPEQIEANKIASEQRRIENNRLRRVVCYDADGTQLASKFTNNATLSSDRQGQYATAWSNDSKYTETYRWLSCKIEIQAEPK